MFPAFVDHSSEWNTKVTVIALENFTKTACLLLSHPMWRLIDKKVAVEVTNTTESPLSLKRKTQIGEFSVVTPEQSKSIKPVDTAILSMIPGSDPELNTYFKEILKTNKPEQQNNTFWYPTTETPGKPEDHTPIQTRNLTELLELKKKEKLKPQKDMESRTKIFERFEWVDTLLTYSQKLKNKQSKTFWSSVMTASPDTEWILRWIRSSRWNPPPKTTKMSTTQAGPCQATWKETKSSN